MEYEDLISQPVDTLGSLLDFLDLDWTPQFAEVVRNKTFYNPVNKWRKYLSEDEGNVILEFFERAKDQKEIAAKA
jgi:hypothetical protein